MKITLSRQIHDDLAMRIRRRQPLPCTLTLHALADHYQCSTRPVREALALLRDENLLTPARLKNLTPVETQAITAPSPQQDTAPSAMDGLTNHLIELSLSPSPSSQGQLVREEALAQKFHTSTTVIREQLQRLTGAGLIEHLPRRGWRVLPVTQKTLDDFVRVRLSLETLALDLAWDTLDHDIIGQYLQRNVSPTSHRQAQLDNGFHRYIMQTADNFYILDFFQKQGRFFELLFQWEDQDTATQKQTITQHRRILSAILARDQPAAHEALRVHILTNHPVLARILRK